MQLVLLYPSSQIPVIACLVLAEAKASSIKLDVKLQGVGAKNCPVAHLKVNPSVGYSFSQLFLLFSSPFLFENSMYIKMF